MDIRPKINMKLSTRDIAHRAKATLVRWTNKRLCAYNVERAIVLYDALDKGDLTTLYDMFPMLRNAVGTGRTPYEMPARSYEGVGEVEHVEETDEQKIQNFKDSFGF